MDSVPEVDGSRALTTTADRQKLAMEGEYDDDNRYQAVALIRQRINSLEEDREILEEHHPELLDELQEVFCG